VRRVLMADRVLMAVRCRISAVCFVLESNKQVDIKNMRSVVIT
jgi:hypothetical protein